MQIDPSDPWLTIEALVKDPEEDQHSAQMEVIFEGAMQLLGDPDRVLYAELSSMVQYTTILWWRAHATSGTYLTVPPARLLKVLPSCTSRRGGELLNKIDSYLDNCRMECGIIVPTCLHTPVLILDPKECMRRYHNPELQGAFPTQFPVEGFGFVQPRNDLRRSIIPPHFRELPTMVAAVMTTLIRGGYSGC